MSLGLVPPLPVAPVPAAPPPAVLPPALPPLSPEAEVGVHLVVDLARVPFQAWSWLEDAVSESPKT